MCANSRTSCSWCPCGAGTRGRALTPTVRTTDGEACALIVITNLRTTSRIAATYKALTNQLLGLIASAHSHTSHRPFTCARRAICPPASPARPAARPRLSEALFFEQVRQTPSRVHSEGHARIDRGRTPESRHRSLRVRTRKRLRAKQPA